MAGFSASPTFVLGFMQASHHGVARRSLGIIVKSVGFVVVVVVVDRGNPLTSFLAGKKKKRYHQERAGTFGRFDKRRV